MISKWKRQKRQERQERQELAAGAARGPVWIRTGDFGKYVSSMYHVV